jgi:hypothetical protein
LPSVGRPLPSSNRRRRIEMAKKAKKPAKKAPKKMMMK